MMLDFEEKALCRKVAGVLELSAERGYEPLAFMHLWLASKTADNLFHWDFYDVAQSKQHLLHSVELEYGFSPQEHGKPQNEDMAADMYWGGYTFMYISLDENRKPCHMEEKYNVERVLKCYDTLHSLSTKVAVDEIRKQFLHRNG